MKTDNPLQDISIQTDALEALAKRIRQLSLIQIYSAGSGHPGGCLSSADLLAYLCSETLGWGAKTMDDGNRDRFVMSKGHACPALYAAAAEHGLIEKSDLTSLRKLGSPLQGHPHVLTTPFAETSTGSLGQGFSAAIGMALALRYQQRSSRVYVMLGDGELQEGQVWEGAMFAGHQGLSNLCGIVDYNKMQSDDLNENIVGLEPLKEKWEAFNFRVLEVDGHNFEQIAKGLLAASESETKPTMMIAHTLKGKGVSFMEAKPNWHGSVALRDEELITALLDLGMSEEQAAGYLNGTN